MPSRSPSARPRRWPTVKRTMPSWRPTHAARHVDDLARLDRLGPQLLHDRGIVAVRHEADVLAVGLVGDRQVEALGQRARLALGQVAEREAQEVELLVRRAEQEVALVARRIGAAMQLGPRLAHHAPDIVAGRQRLGAELARGLAAGRGTSPCDCRRCRAPASRRAHRRRRRSPSPRRGSGSRSRARSAGCRGARRPGGRPGCPGRRSRRPLLPTATPWS